MKVQTDSLRAERKLAGLTQESLAHRAEVSRSAVQFAEYGRPVGAGIIRKLADALGVSVADIATGETEAERAALARQAERAEAS